MVSFIRSQLVHKFPRVVALGTGVLVAAVGFTLLTSAVDTGALTVQGTINANFRPAYDILVRPASSYTPIERERGLVRSNYLSGMYGGISMSEWHEILDLPGVEVAAPIANIGSIMPWTWVPLKINRFLSDEQFQLYRLRTNWIANNATSRYPAAPGYVYYQRRDPLVKGKFSSNDELLPDGRKISPCGTFNSSRQGGSSFDLEAATGLTCFSALSPELATSGFDYGRFPKGYVGYVTIAVFPMLISAIDPAQEQLLLGLDSTVVSGQPLTNELRPERIDTRFTVDWLGVPVLASTKTFVDETLDVDVERLDPGAQSVEQMMGDADVRNRVTALPGRTVGSIQIPISQMYASLLRGFGRSGGLIFMDYNAWAAGPVSYTSLGADKLAPVPVHNSSNVYLSASGSRTPWENKDVQFRELTVHRGSNHIVSGLLQTPSLNIVGRFDPTLLPGFSALSQVPLESYYPPTVEPADEASTEALGGKPLLPTQNLADYIAQPPLLLTNMRGLKPFMNEDFFYPAVDAKAPISVIRVRVEGVTGADPISLARIRTVAELIHERTGLSIDITAGSSPRPMQISLPAGKFGRPPLEVNEPWVETGVAVRFLRALDTKSLLLFILVLVVCVLFLANASFASVRVRRKEIGTLLCLGWSKKDISRVILVELAAIGLVAGVVGSAVAWGLANALDIDLEGWKVLAIAPISILLTVVAGILPARRTASATPMDAVNPPVVERGRTRRVRGPATMALANLARIPSRTLVAAFGLFIGVAALSILVAVNAAFKDALVGTLLGHAISLQVRPVDFLSVALVLSLAGLSVADVLYLNIRERAAELVTLRTSGWRRRDEISLVAFEALGIGGLGSVAGAALGMVVSGFIVRGVGIGPVLQGGATGIAAGLVAALLASIIPAIRLGGLTPAVVLSEE